MTQVTQAMINRYVDNLDADATKQLLKQCMAFSFFAYTDEDVDIEQIIFLQKQVIEFNDQYGADK